MNIAKIQQNLEELVNDISKQEFIFDLLASYGLPKASITRLKRGDYNLSNKPKEIIWKKRLLFQEVGSEHLHDRIYELSTNPKVRKHDLRFIIVTDHEHLLAEDTKTRETLDILISDLPKHFDFFLPWAGMEKTQHVNENPADVKAAEKLAKLYDEIKKENATETQEEAHDLNVFLSRLLFCFFAEDTGIFEEGIFTNSISSHTQEDGSDLQRYLNELFDALDDKEKENVPAYLKAFPYVNGGLFYDKHNAPKFTKRSRRVIIECGELDWAAINPDIFGSMMQAVITPEQREGLGIHYTSVPNILKVIEPLFLNGLYDDFEKNKYKPQKLHKLLQRLSKIKIFDPACGSGNFLIIAYKQLRYFEIKVLKQLQKIQQMATTLDSPQQELIPKSQLSLAAIHQLPLFTRIQLSQFYGIEIDDFAHEIATLSLWLAEHQMNLKFKEQFGKSEPSLPLKDSGNIFHGNAMRLNWNNICEPNDDKEIYLIGNPPYLGSSMQNKEQKEDLKKVFKSFDRFKNLDYIACWFKIASDYIVSPNIECAFVSTNSITQGEQVNLLWPYIIRNEIEIGFACTSFKWTNNAKSAAAVIVVIIGLRKNQRKEKYIFEDGIKRKVENINPYLVDGPNITLPRRGNPLSNLPKMIYGNKATDGGNLILDERKVHEFIKKNPGSEKFLKKYFSGKDFLVGQNRWCIWIEDDQLSEAKKISGIRERLDKVKQFRLNSKAASTNEYAKYPHKFRQITFQKNSSVLIPLTTSENRSYIPFGFVGDDTIVSNSSSVIYTDEIWVFGVLCSEMHMKWVNAVSGRLKTDIRYSKAITYNNFPFPSISSKRKEELNQSVIRIIEEREKHTEKTLAQLYDLDKMPEGLRDAHKANDRAIEQCYRSEPFISDEERLEVLFEMYEKMIVAEEN